MFSPSYIKQTKPSTRIGHSETLSELVLFLRRREMKNQTLLKDQRSDQLNLKESRTACFKIGNHQYININAETTSPIKYLSFTSLVRTYPWLATYILCTFISFIIFQWANKHKHNVLQQKSLISISFFKNQNKANLVWCVINCSEYSKREMKMTDEKCVWMVTLALVCYNR